MKNIHVLPTDKPSRLYEFGNRFNIQDKEQENFRSFNIYITSDEEIKEGEWCTDGIYLIQATPKLVDAQGLFDRRDWRKIILTTDQDLIKDGVQSIDDKFLEWFIKNPSCELVEVIPLRKSSGYYDDEEVWHWDFLAYKIIIPKEEPKTGSITECIKMIIDNQLNELEELKQETLEEAAFTAGEESFKEFRKIILEASRFDFVCGFTAGAKWQQEQDKNKYSEVFEWLANKDYLSDEVDIIQKEFEQFKKK